MQHRFEREPGTWLKSRQSERTGGLQRAGRTEGYFPVAFDDWPALTALSGLILIKPNKVVPQVNSACPWGITPMDRFFILRYPFSGEIKKREEFF